MQQQKAAHDTADEHGRIWVIDDGTQGEGNGIHDESGN